LIEKCVAEVHIVIPAEHRDPFEAKKIEIKIRVRLD
jgi:hypothetical protein